MFEKFLTAAGLSENEAQVYEILLADGQSTAGKLHKKAPFKRGLIYKILDELVEKRLINRVDMPGKVAVFRVEHPQKITELLDAQQQQIRHYKKSLEELMPQMVSNYNLAFNKPGIRFFEGIEGVKKVLADTLTAKEVIYSYADAEAVIKYMEEVNREYVKKRDRLKIKKRLITIDSPFVRKFFRDYFKEITDVKFIDHSLYPMSSVVQIYDNRVAYISLSKDSYVAMIISDKNIYQTEKNIFEFVWKYAKSFDQLSPLPDLSKQQYTSSPLEEKK